MIQKQLVKYQSQRHNKKMLFSARALGLTGVRRKFERYVKKES